MIEKTIRIVVLTAFVLTLIFHTTLSFAQNSDSLTPTPTPTADPAATQGVSDRIKELRMTI